MRTNPDPSRHGVPASSLLGTTTDSLVEASTLISLGPDELSQIVTDAVSKVLAVERGPSGFMRAKEAAAFLGLSENALRIAVRRGEIPVHRLGDRVLFSKDELDSFIRSGDAA